MMRAEWRIKLLIITLLVVVIITTYLLRPRHRTLLLYMVSHDDGYQRERITKMQSIFKDNFRVVWDNNNTTKKCPFTGIATCIGDEVQVSKCHRFNFICCGLEKAVLWSIENKDSFDYVWFMEDDIYYTDVSELAKVITTSSSADLLHQANFSTLISDGDWFWAPRVRRETRNLFGKTQLEYSMFNLYRMSVKLLEALDSVYTQNDHEWVFFEALIPTTVAHYNLTATKWPSLQADKKSTYQLRYRPCYDSFPVPGLYHPAKFEHGIPQSCDYQELDRFLLEDNCNKDRV